jgi:hypothetical protein
MNSMHLGNSCKYGLGVIFSWVVSQQISSTNVKLLQDDVKITSSQIELLA